MGKLINGIHKSYMLQQKTMDVKRKVNKILFETLAKETTDFSFLKN